MLEFISNLFSQNGFMPHGHCYLWRPEILWMHVVSDLIIAVAYYSIPLAMAIILVRRRSFPFKWLIALFAGFILLCGTSHIVAIVTQWNPIYRFEGIMKLMTALASIATAIVLFPLLPKLVAAGDELAREMEEQEPDY